MANNEIRASEEKKINHQIPDCVLSALLNRMDTLKQTIEEASKEYMEIYNYLTD